MFLIPLISILVLLCLAIFILVRVNKSLKSKAASSVKKVVTNIVVILLMVLTFPEVWFMSVAYLQELSGTEESSDSPW